jgi:MarR family transcriptional regulator, lower aerobic nicotinate degradation pathway regulator
MKRKLAGRINKEKTLSDPLDVGGRPFRYREQVGHLLRRAMQHHVSIFERICPEEQLTPAQFAVLCAAIQHGPVSQNQLARLCAIDPSTMKGIIERLTNRNLLALGRVETDRRKLLVQPTTAGRSLVARMAPIGFRISDETMGPLNPAERVAFIYLLNKMIGADDAPVRGASGGDS